MKQADFIKCESVGGDSTMAITQRKGCILQQDAVVGSVPRRAQLRSCEAAEFVEIYDALIPHRFCS